MGMLRHVVSDHNMRMNVLPCILSAACHACQAATLGLSGVRQSLLQIKVLLDAHATLDSSVKSTMPASKGMHAAERRQLLSSSNRVTNRLGTGGFAACMSGSACSQCLETCDSMQWESACSSMAKLGCNQW